jgi:hypothetical protein
MEITDIRDILGMPAIVAHMDIGHPGVWLRSLAHSEGGHGIAWKIYRQLRNRITRYSGAEPTSDLGGGGRGLTHRNRSFT